MAEDQMLFTVDASDILVKLHFAGIQAVRTDAKKDNGFFFNSGVVNDDPRGTPEKIGNTKFNLDNKSGLYCAGIVRDLKYNMTFDMQNALTDIFKLRAELYGEQRKLLDTADPKKVDEFKNCVKTIKDGFDKLGAAVPEEDDFRTEEGLTKIRNDAARLQKDIVMSGYNSSVYKSKEAVSNTIERYMKVFAGADNVNAIKVENVSDVQVSGSIKSIKDIPAMLDAFDIKPISDQEKTKLNEYFKSQALKNKDKNNEIECVVRMCFYVKYKLNIEQ